MLTRYIFAIDPGPIQSAYVFWGFGEKDHPRQGNRQNEDLMTIIWDTNFDQLVLEMVQSFGMSVGKEIFETVFWIGRFFQTAKGAANRIYRKEVKSYLCGSMKAKDGNIRQALIELIGPQGTKKAKGPTYGVKADEWQALGVAITFTATLKETPCAP